MHTKLGPARHKFADNSRLLLGYRKDVLGCKVYFIAIGTVIDGRQVTVNETVMYKDRHGPEFKNYVYNWAVDQYPDLTCASRHDYNLPFVGGDRPAINNDVDPTIEGEEGPAIMMTKAFVTANIRLR